MPSNILICGNRLNSRELEKAFTRLSEQQQDVVLVTEPIVPRINSSEITAFIDLENDDFNSSSFMADLIDTFDNIKIIGVADSLSENQTIEFATLGVSEILSPDEYRLKIEARLKKPKKETAGDPVGNKQYEKSSILGKSPQMLAVKDLVDSLENVDYPSALIIGETGTGKDLLAKVLHYNGLRNKGPFIEVNCSAIPDQLFESELFGHIKGAFTDAKSDKVGLFEYAHNGTIFLDEIANLSHSAQAKLLKIVENRRLRPLGSIEEKSINVRVHAATNIDLSMAVQRGEFRKDLYYRLNLITIQLPPLRERKEDIHELAIRNFEYYCTLYNKKNLKISKDAVEKLSQYDWPGNVRQLRNVIERIVLLSSGGDITSVQTIEALKHGRITAKERRQITIDIPEQGITLREIERKIVGEILNMVDWNRSEASRILGISRTRLRRIIEENKLSNNRRK